MTVIEARRALEAWSRRVESPHPLRDQVYPGRPTILSGRYGMLPAGFEQDWLWMATRLRESLELPG